MQAIVCRQHIGWRDNARRLIVFATDSGLEMNTGDEKVCFFLSLTYPLHCLNQFSVK